MSDWCEELKEGQIEIWLESEEAMASLVRDMAFVFQLNAGYDAVVIPIQRSTQTEELGSNKNLVRYRRPPSGFHMWLLEVPAIKDTYAMFAFVAGWMLSRKKGEYTGRHNAACRSALGEGAS